MALIDDDEWKPDPDYEESILKKIVVNFTGNRMFSIYNQIHR